MSGAEAVAAVGLVVRPFWYVVTRFSTNGQRKDAQEHLSISLSILKNSINDLPMKEREILVRSYDKLRRELDVVNGLKHFPTSWSPKSIIISHKFAKRCKRLGKDTKLYSERAEREKLEPFLVSEVAVKSVDGTVTPMDEVCAGKVLETLASIISLLPSSEITDLVRESEVSKSASISANSVSAQCARSPPAGIKLGGISLFRTYSKDSLLSVGSNGWARAHCNFEDS